jgi:hypothetical protein
LAAQLLWSEKSVAIFRFDLNLTAANKLGSKVGDCLLKAAQESLSKVISAPAVGLGNLTLEGAGTSFKLVGVQLTEDQIEQLVGYLKEQVKNEFIQAGIKENFEPKFTISRYTVNRPPLPENMPTVSAMRDLPQTTVEEREYRLECLRQFQSNCYAAVEQGLVHLAVRSALLEQWSVTRDVPRVFCDDLFESLEGADLETYQSLCQRKVGYVPQRRYIRAPNTEIYPYLDVVFGQPTPHRDTGHWINTRNTGSIQVLAALAKAIQGDSLEFQVLMRDDVFRALDQIDLLFYWAEIAEHDARLASAYTLKHQLGRERFLHDIKATIRAAREYPWSIQSPLFAPKGDAFALVFLVGSHPFLAVGDIDGFKAFSQTHPPGEVDNHYLDLADMYPKLLAHHMRVVHPSTNLNQAMQLAYDWMKSAQMKLQDTYRKRNLVFHDRAKIKMSNGDVWRMPLFLPNESANFDEALIGWIIADGLIFRSLNEAIPQDAKPYLSNEVPAGLFPLMNTIGLSWAMIPLAKIPEDTSSLDELIAKLDSEVDHAKARLGPAKGALVWASEAD